jgi:Flp pilus assembly pilin Flp
MDAPFSGASQGALRNGGRRKTSRMGEGGTMRQAVTVLSQLKKDEDGATLTKYTAALIAILIVVVILAVREVGSWISDSGKQPRSAGSM